MDWKHILSLAPENLSEDEKDQLYSSVAWFDYDNEALDKKKYLALLKISQEIMKHKAEQVEALLAELDEIAVRQGEEEGRKQTSYEDLQAVKSKSTSDYDDLEEKYKEIKSRLKQQIKASENQRKDIERLQQTTSLLEQEKLHLQEELRSVLSRGDDSHSDMSESGANQQKELVDMVQEKNKQISTLLSDVEGVELENVSLRETISKLRDNLQDATAQVALITKEFSATKIKFNDTRDSLKELKDENDALKLQMHDVLEDKQLRDGEIEKFTADVDSRVDVWKKILDDKNEEIEKLKTQILTQSSRRSSETSLDVDYSHGEVLNKVFNEREDQLIDLQAQLESATKEMDKSTLAIQQLNLEKAANLHKIDELNLLVDELKEQLRTARERSRELHENVTYAESTAKSKQDELDEITKNLRSNKEVLLANSLEKIQSLKSQVRIQEKKIRSYVKIINKLQSSVDDYEQENIALRDKCGISSNENVDINGVILKKRKQGKELEKLQKHVLLLEDEKLQLKGRIHNLNRQISTISLPVTNEAFATEDASKDKNDSKYINVLEENDALRKGLQEVLESIQTKNESTKKEIKSETLEKLLKALDMRHISGWYHPAMRLQAELHTVQGINLELREQLRTARSEFNKHWKGSSVNSVKGQSDAKDIDKIDNRSPVDSKALNREPLSQSDFEDINHEHPELRRKLEEYSKMFEVIDHQLNLLYDQYNSEKSEWQSKEKHYESTKNELEEKTEVLEAKLKEFSTTTNLEEFKKVEHYAEMSAQIVVLNRKCVFLENEESKLVFETKKLKTDLKNAEIATLDKFGKLSNENKDLQNKIVQTERLLSNTIDRQTYLKLQNDLDNLTLKYRKVLNDFNCIKSDYSSQLVVLTETVKLAQEQKDELRNGLIEAKSKLNLQETGSHSNEVEVLVKKLAQCEVNEISEKQRANHMSNLYNLVKEQLEKSETRLGDLDKQNQGLLQKNLALQERIKETEDKLLECVDAEIVKAGAAKYEALLRQKEELVLKNDQLKSDLAVLKKKDLSCYSSSEASNSLEVLNLKHQILDLQASSDDKALIARLSSDVVLARLSETQCQKRLEELEIDLKEYQDSCLSTKALLEQERINKANIIDQLQNKIRNLEQVLRHSRQQFLGCTPLISQEAFNESLRQILKDKQTSFKSLENIRKTENECLGLKEELNKSLHLVNDFRVKNENCSESLIEKFKSWQQEKNIILIKELRSQREVEFKSVQLEQVTFRLNYQDELISKLQEELLECYNNSNPLPSQIENKIFVTTSVQTEEKSLEKPKSSKQQEIQTNLLDVPNLTVLQVNDSALLNSLKVKISSLEEDLGEKAKIIDLQKSKIAEIEMNVSLFRTQIGDKQSQIAFYEKHIMELQSKITKQADESTLQQVDGIHASADEVALLKDSLAKLQETNVHKDEVVLKLQRLLKKDRDEHSMAASRVQQEMQRLQDIIVTQEKTYKELKETSIQHPGKAAIEQYIVQVHALEKHTSELHTTVTKLTSQLQASRQEAVRWQTLANERLDSMEQLRNDLEDQHQNELQLYKRDSDRWRDEMVKAKDSGGKYKSSGGSDSDFQNKLKEKDERIQELNTTTRQLKSELKKHSEKTESLISPKLSELELANEQQFKEYETLKKRYEQVLQRERMAKDEIYSLKEQLLKRPPSTTRSDKNEKEQLLLKKIANLEKENENLKTKLERQLEINDTHKIAVAGDFGKWKKQKYWQQTADKLKIKLQEKTDECEKLNCTCSSYKGLIERLEREKHGLEGRIKSLRSEQGTSDSKRFDVLLLENEELHMQIQNLKAKIEMQQHHSGALGAVMLQEKLEAQERKIAILELSSKGSSEVRGEIERLQSTIENLQKLNLRLEAESLEFKLDLENSKKELPHMREQIGHLENYIRALKSENESQQGESQSDSKLTQKQESKKLSELERTVFVLKRVVEKLQIENKRLQGGSRACSTSVGDRLDKLRADYNRLKEQYGESVQQVARLEDQLKSVRSTTANVDFVMEELSKVKSELSYKSQLLDKVKILLHRAAVKEKTLLEEIAQLKAIINSNGSSPDSHLS